jgi:hypothetical protein
LRLESFQATATAARHVPIAAARKLRCVRADVRWRWTLKTTPIAESNNSTARSEPQDIITYCDRYAASELDGQSLVIGLPINRVDPRAAIPACLDAVAKHPDSARLTYMLGRAYAANKEFSKAREAFSKAADSNFALAQLDLGFLYFNGLGVPQDYAEAAKWTRLAADQGLAPAQASLGAMYLDGKGVEQNRVKAAGLLKSAAVRGFAPQQAAEPSTGRAVPLTIADRLSQRQLLRGRLGELRGRVIMRHASRVQLSRCRFAPDSDHGADMPACLKCAMNGSQPHFPITQSSFWVLEKAARSESL